MRVQKVGQRPKAIYFKGEKTPLSNLYETEANNKFKGKHFRSSENAYQYQKCIKHSNPVLASIITNPRCTSRKAIQVGRMVPTNSQWETSKNSLMLALLQEKFLVSQAYRKAVLDSFPKLLVEDTNHPYWGRGKKNEGLNWMGTLHLKIRHTNIFKRK